ncbi:MAG: hypothetical protein CVT77_12155 [Alphaproteobacteria bacterium HGW-Alphaproteobacteria-16]|nr:MAG: hypothetical protein CVT77_12155 [Alphaproteobacteria bacterium HGW-Alphaproteobacteria-16]
MSIFEFVSQDELDDLDEDHRVAFMQLVNAAQRSLSTKVEALDPDNQYEWQKAEELRYSFMNVVVAAAKRFEIEPFHSMEVPQYANFRHADHRQFKSDLDHYVTQLVLDNSLRSRQDSVEVLPNTKDQLRTYVSGLRQCIESGNMTVAKREALLKKLDAFESELEKRRLNMLTVAKFAYLILSVPGTMWASADITHKLTTNIMQTVAEAKVAEDETRQFPATAPLKALSAPRQPAPTKDFPDFDSDLDGDVPF